MSRYDAFSDSDSSTSGTADEESNPPTQTLPQSLRGIAWHSFLLGLWNFAFVPLGYVTASLASLEVVYGLVALQLVVGAACQGWLVRRLRAVLVAHQAATSCGCHLSEALAELDGRRWYMPLIKVEVFWLLLGLPEFVDPILDAATAGKAKESLSPADAVTFRDSWHRVPLIGAVVGSLGLSGVLTVLLVFATGYQMFSMFGYHRRARRQLDEWSDALEKGPNSDDNGGNSVHPEHDLDTTFGTFLMWGHAADCSNLMLLGDVLNHLAKVSAQELRRCGSSDKYCYADRSVKFLSKSVCEALPAMWFQVSLLALTLHKSRLSLFTNCLSVATGFFTVLAGIPDYVTASRQLAKVKTYKLQNLILFRCFPLVVSALLLATTLIRVVGVWACPRHILNLSTLSCWQGNA